MKLAAVILAAGRSRRFGSADKLLADLCGANVVGWTARAILDAGFDEVVVVTGAGDAARRAALAGLALRFAVNPAPDDGQGRSIASGVASLAADCGGALIVPADMPALTTAMVGRLAAAFRDGAGRLVTHFVVDGAPRPPVIWPRALFAELVALDGDRSGRHVLARHAGIARGLAPADDEVWRLDDIDTPDDLAMLAHRLVTAGGRRAP